MKFKLIYLIAIVLLTSCDGDEEEQLPLQVSADFTASHTKIKVGESITFNDRSYGNVTTWNWVFEGGEPNKSTEKNPVVKYDSPGSFSASLSVSNSSSSDTEVKENFIKVEVKESIPGSFVAADETTFGLSVRTDAMQSMIILDDQSLVCAGWTNNENTLTSPTNILVAKFDKNLELVWDKLIGGSSHDLVRKIIPTNDGGFLLSATTESNDGDIPENKGLGDIAIIKLNGDGDIQWVETYGGSDHDGVNKHSLIKLDEGYAFIGFSKSEDADIPGKVGLQDIWLVEIDTYGSINNSFAVGSVENDYPYSFVKSEDGYVVLSKIGAQTVDFDKPGIWLFEVNRNGQIGWKTFIDGLNAGEVIKTLDDGYLTLNTKKVNVTDLFVTKFNNQGHVQWENSYPLPDQEFAQNVIDNGNEYIILGSSESYTGPDRFNAYVAKIDQGGDIVQWELFGDDKGSASTILKLNDGRYILGGSKDVGESFINTEFWLQIILDEN